MSRFGKIVKRTDKEGGFKVLRRRRSHENVRSITQRNRRLMAHYEALVMIAVAFAKLAIIGVIGGGSNLATERVR